MKKRTLSLLLLLSLAFSLFSCDKAPEPADTAAPETEEPKQQIAVIDNGGAYGGELMKNPYSTITKIGDPFILYANGAYYMYATSTGTGFKCWKSKLLDRWTELGVVYQKTDATFGDQKFWAPECHEYKGKYYLVFSAQNARTQIHSIGIAVADKPEGPFTDLLGGKALFAPSYSVIDASLFFDDDGKCYLYYSKDNSTNYIGDKRVSQSCVIELTNDLKQTVGDPILLTTPTEAWELKSGNVIWNEGPCVFKRNGVYYLMFSANYYAAASYCVGYATATSPTGPFTKPKNNPILQGDGKLTSGTGHNNFFFSPDGTEMFTVYHSHTDVKNPSGDRTPCIDRMVFAEDGTLSVNGPSTWRQPLPSGLNGITTIHGGVKAELDGKEAKLLLDGSTGSLATGTYCKLTGESAVKLTFDEETPLTFVWIYPASYPGYIPQTATVTVNGEYRIENVRFSADKKSPALCVLTELPEGTKVKTLEITVALKDGQETAGLSEIILQKKEK